MRIITKVPKKLWLVKAAVWLVFAKLAFGTCVCIASESKPNVVIVITDDQGYGDLSCHGNPILKTPNLDQLYKESIRLTDYHVSPTCSPTRAAFQTGHWSNRTGVWHTIMGRSMIRENEVTMGQVFKDAGYATGMFGKWHLGDNYPFRPEDRGYTYVLRHGGGGVGQTPDYWDNAYFDGSYWENGKPVPVEGFCTDVFFESAKKFMKAQKAAGKPFLAYISTNAPHSPYHSPVEFSKTYSDQPGNVANFFGMIANIDHNVGKLREFLKAESLEENTILIFTTDNGTAAGRKVFHGGMRGAKGSEYDGGHRVPFFLSWPAQNMGGGRAISHIAAHVDVLPTLIELCELTSPSVKFDGLSLAPLFRGEKVEWKDRILVTDSQRVKDPIKWRKSSVMTKEWRLVNQNELYNVKSDPLQKTNVIAEHPQVAKRLADFYEEWWADLKPTFGTPAYIKIGSSNENPARLTSHDWISDRGVPWNQAHVRNAGNGTPDSIGFWYVDVVESGEYEFELRRWPREADKPICAPLPSGEDVPGAQAFRARPGVAIDARSAVLEIGAGFSSSKPVSRDDKTVVFSVELEKGVNKVKAWFETAKGASQGAYFVYARRIEK